MLKVKADFKSSTDSRGYGLPSLTLSQLSKPGARK
jgi:hypothetical protein